MKKQTRILIALALLLGPAALPAQKPFAGTISFGTTAEGTEDVNILSVLANQSVDIIVKGNNSKTVLNQGGVGVIDISNGDYSLKTTVVDFSAMGMGKYYIEMDAEKLKEKFSTSKFDYDYTAETRPIGKYTCRKVLVKVTDLESDETKDIVVWVTDGLLLGENINFSSYPGLKGYPLRTEIKQETDAGETITIIQEAKTFTPSRKLKDSAFLRPSDATLMENAPDEIKQMLGIE